MFLRGGYWYKSCTPESGSSEVWGNAFPIDAEAKRTTSDTDEVQALTLEHHVTHRKRVARSLQYVQFHVLPRTVFYLYQLIILCYANQTNSNWCSNEIGNSEELTLIEKTIWKNY